MLKDDFVFEMVNLVKGNKNIEIIWFYVTIVSQTRYQLNVSKSCKHLVDLESAFVILILPFHVLTRSRIKSNSFVLVELLFTIV